MTDYPSYEEVLATHEIMLKLYGGADGIRDPGMIDAALNRPRNGYYDDLIQEAAALWESMSQNHPFIDGNKRTAFAVADMFLRANGYRLTAQPLDAYAFMMDLYETGQFRFERLEAWLRENTMVIRRQG